MKRIFSYVMLVLLTLSMLSLLTPVRAEVQGEQEPYISVDPLESTVMVGDTFTINITVTNITDLFIWQFRLYFNSTILRYDGAWYPGGHVFDDKGIVPVTPVEGSDENGNYIDYGCTLVLVDDVFTGSGILCQINFTGFVPGSSALSFSETAGRDTFLLDSNLQDMDFDVTDGNITVRGISVAKEDSEITLALSSEDVDVGDDVTMSGAITPVQGIVNVTIRYKEAGEVSWVSLANVLTNSESQYTYTWTTTEKGTYDIKASWPGDADTWPDESATKRIRIRGEEEAMDIIPYVIAGIVAVIAIVAIAIYFVKFRKPE